MNESENNKKIIEVKATLRLSEDHYHIARSLARVMKCDFEDYISSIIEDVVKAYVERFCEQHLHIEEQVWDSFNKHW